MTDPTPLPWNAFGDSLGALLDARADRDPARVFVTHVGDDRAEAPRTFAETRAGARAAAAGLAAAGVGAGDRVMIILPTGPAFVDAFFGAGYLGAAAVPAYPPARTRGLDEYEARLARLIAAARPRLIVADPRARLVVEAAAFRAGVGGKVVPPDALAGVPPLAAPSPAGPGDVALVQFSSGSTGDPRGVVLTHRQVLANLAAAIGAMRPPAEATHVTWLPLYHDMGLLGGLLMPLFARGHVVMLSPQAFLLDPKRWLQAISRHRAISSTAPNFAYQLCAARLDDAELAGLDLSCWKYAMNGAEPIHVGTLEAFADRMAPHGFDRRALMPVYGMAEVALAATFHDPLSRPIRVEGLDPAALGEGLATPSDAPDARPQVAVGRPLAGYAVRVVDEAGADLPDRRVGEVLLQGPSVMAGYLDAPAATRAALRDGWLHTGDLGYLADGDLFVVGRRKDLIVKAGRNWLPQDLERAAEGVPGVRKGCAAAFGVPDPVAGTEAVVVVCETREPEACWDALARAVSARVQAEAGLAPDRVALVPPGSVPKTSSGKIQRGRCKDRWLAGALAAPAEPGLLDRAGLLGRALVHRARGGRDG